MNNCRLVQFKGSVSDNSLPIYGSFGFDLEPGTFNMYIAAPQGTIITFNSVDTIKVGVDTISSGWIFPSASSQRFNGTITTKTHFEINGLYGITTLSQLSDNTCVVSIRDLASALMYGSITYLALTKAEVEGEIAVAEIKNPSAITRFQYEVGNLVGHTSDFEAFTGTDKILITGNSYVQGSIGHFSTLTSLNQLDVVDCDNINGTIESLVEGQCSASRTSGTLLIYTLNSKCTFNGNARPNASITFNSTGATVKSASNVLLGTYANGSWSYE